MTIYNFVLFAHIVGVIGLFAAVVMQWVVVVGITGARTVGPVRTWTTLVPTIERTHPISTALIILSGLYMAIVQWGLAQAWIDAAFVIIILMAVLGARVIVPRLRAIKADAEVAPEGALPDILIREINDSTLATVFRIQTATAFVLVLLMTNKPDLLATVGIIIVGGVVGIVWARAYSGTRAGAASNREPSAG